MLMKKRRIFLLSFFVFLSVFLLAQHVSVQAQERGGIVFPIPELGSCKDADTCRGYCDMPEHEPECSAYAARHNIIIDKKNDGEGVRGKTGPGEAAPGVNSENKEAIVLPPEGGPGGCASDGECRAYCDAAEHRAECLNFAERHGLIKPKDAQKMRHAIEQGRADIKTGPGGCNSEESCGTYCKDSAHLEECVRFGVEKGFMTPKEGEQALAQGRLVREESGPGGCKNEQECNQYCAELDHAQECITFGREHGFMSEQEAEEALRYVQEGRQHPQLNKEHPGPGGCANEQECHAYCEDSAHREICLDFGVAQGFMTPEEAQQARKFSRLDNVEGPGGCRGKSCKDYCEQPGHEEECLDFAVTQGIMPPEKAAQARKFLNASRDGGPGGCRGRACEQYCNDPAHQEECFAFADKNGLISEKERQNFDVGRKLDAKLKESGGPGGCATEQECMVYCEDPAHVEECVAFASVHGGVSTEDAEQMLKDFTQGSHKGPSGSDFGPPGFGSSPPEDFNRFQGAEKERLQRFRQFQQLEERFRGEGGEKFGPSAEFRGEQGGLQGNTPADFFGPGGCKTPRECIAYCQKPEHRSECGLGGGGEVAPGNEEGGDSRRQIPINIIPRRNIPDGERGMSGEFERNTFMPTATPTRTQAKARLQLNNRSGFFELEIIAPSGLSEFSMTKDDGTMYGGGIGCQNKYENKNINLQGRMPTSILVKDCEGGELLNVNIVRDGDQFRLVPPGTALPSEPKQLLQPEKREGGAQSSEEFLPEEFRQGDRVLQRLPNAEELQRIEETSRNAPRLFNGTIVPLEGVEIPRVPVPSAEMLVPAEHNIPLEPTAPQSGVNPNSLFGQAIEAFRGFLLR